VKSADMADYYLLLARRVRETENDPAKLRQLVFEAARLALGRQVNLHNPPLASSATRRHMGDLENAIAVIEASAANGTAISAPPQSEEEQPVAEEHDSGEPEHDERDDDERDSDDGDLDEQELDGRDSQRHRDREHDEDEKPAKVERIEPVELLEPQAWDEPQDRPSRPQSRELVLLPPRSLRERRPPPFLVNADEFAVRTETIYRAPPPPQPSRGRMLLSGVGVLFQLGVAVLAGVAFYVAVWGRDPSLPSQADAPSAASQSARATARAAPRSEIGTAANAAGEASGTPAQATPAAGPSFPRPAAYGIYAISENRLIELEQIPTAPVDPRTRTTLQIAKPSRTVISDAKLSFVAYRRDFVANAPEKVPVRVAARIAKSMNFDSTGKAVVTPPTTETWLIRDQGYDMRVSPVRDSPEMVLLRPESPDFSFPSGRYTLMLGGQAYDFVVAGAVTDPSQCVEGTATVRGPMFYECKAQ